MCIKHHGLSPVVGWLAGLCGIVKFTAGYASPSPSVMKDERKHHTTVVYHNNRIVLMDDDSCLHAPSVSGRQTCNLIFNTFQMFERFSAFVKNGLTCPAMNFKNSQLVGS